MSSPAPSIAALRRVARAAPPLRSPARAFSAHDSLGVMSGDWNHELPSTGIEVIVELSGAWELDIGGRRRTVRSFAAGLVAAPVRTRGHGHSELVQLAVDPLAIPALFGVPAGELSGMAVGLDALAGPDASLLIDALGHLDRGHDRTETADRWAIERVDRDADRLAVAPPPDVVRAVALLRASRGALRIDELATELGCSRRHLARRFATWVGVTPAEFRRLVRFEHATEALRRDPTRALGSLAVAAGYADHAHMDREFRALAGRPPRTVASRFSGDDRTGVRVSP